MYTLDGMITGTGMDFYFVSVYYRCPPADGAKGVSFDAGGGAQGQAASGVQAHGGKSH